MNQEHFLPVVPDIVRLWGLRILVRLNALQELFYQDKDGTRLRATNMVSQLIGQDVDEHMPFSLVSRLAREALSQMEQATTPLFPNETLERNLGWMADRLELDQTERELLVFMVTWQTDPVLYECVDNISDPVSHNAPLHAVIGPILDRSPDEIRRVLESDARLVRSGVLSVQQYTSRWERDLDDRLILLDGLAERALLDHAHPAEMLSEFFALEPEPQLGIEDYRHIAEPVEAIRDYLSNALKQREPGANVLIHGPPGTGKTQLARLLGRLCGALVYAVPHMDRDEDDLNGKDRLRAYQLAQSLLAPGAPAIILFDEIEDAFGNERTGISGDVGKAWMNHLLETNPVPGIWIGNSIDSMDSAWLRRFDLILEMPIPPVPARRRVLARYLDGTAIDPRWERLIAHADWISPANIRQAVRFARLRGREPGSGFEQDLALHLNGLAQSNMNASPLEVEDNTLLADFDPALANCDPAADVLLERLAGINRCRILLHGPAGSGKSAFAKALARRSQRMVETLEGYKLEKWFEDLTIGGLLGELRAIHPQTSLLLVDRPERMPDSRRMNVLMECLDEFSGVCLVTTDRADRLDQGILNGFDLVVAFRPLARDQRWRLFADIIERNGLQAEAHHRQRLDRLSGLTYGDFQAVLRRQRLLHDALDPDRFLSALEREHAHRRLEARIPKTEDEAEH